MCFGVNATSVQNSGFWALGKKYTDVCSILSNMRKTYCIVAFSSIQLLPVGTAEKQQKPYS